MRIDTNGPLCGFCIRLLLIATFDHRIIRADPSGSTQEVLATLSNQQNIVQLMGSPDGKSVYVLS
jgi:hypothetical protein